MIKSKTTVSSNRRYNLHQMTENSTVISAEHFNQV